MFLIPEITIIILVLIFGVIHSVFARDFIKERLRVIPSYHRFYGINASLNLVLLIFIELLLAQSGTQTEVVIENPLIGIMFVLIGGFLFLGSMIQFHFSNEGHLIYSGFFAFARHPIYLGGIILLTSIGLFFFTNTVHIMFFLSLSFYLFVGSLIEDYYLLRNVPKYTEYRERCGKFFPWRRKHLDNFLLNLNPQRRK